MFWPCVMRTIKQTRKLCIKRVLCSRLFVPKHTGKQAHNGINDRQGCNFTPREHEIPQRKFLCHTTVDESLVNPFVAATNQNGTLPLRKLLSMRLVKFLTGGAHQND